MGAMLEAAIWFWLPLILVPIGLGITISGKNKIIGKVIAAIGLILVMISAWTVPSSDSSAAGHLLLSILGPSILMGYGLYGVVFGGHVPVARLDKSARWSGILAVISSLVIFCIMHWGALTPIWRGSVNPYWIVFWPTFLMFATALCSLSSVALVGFGNNRAAESIKLAALSTVIVGIALAAMFFGGEQTTAEEFRGHLWLAAADIFGTIGGIALAIGAFTIVIWTYESNLKPPLNSEPPTKEEIKHVVGIAKSHIGGEDDE
tara:strand:+ start:2652 stop:3437 length:786 start_codon:yes stop_codon:yes gene_type:complete